MGANQTFAKATTTIDMPTAQEIQAQIEALLAEKEQVERQTQEKTPGPTASGTTAEEPRTAARERATSTDETGVQPEGKKVSTE